MVKCLTSTSSALPMSIRARSPRPRMAERFVDTLDELFERERPDIVSVAVPTVLHHDVVMQAIEYGVHVLVEKPIASTVAEAERMIVAAERANVKLMVGHIERFNPAIIELKRLLDQVGTIFQIVARRVGPFPERIRDVGVTVDLASHDIDAMRFLLGESVERVYAETSLASMPRTRTCCSESSGLPTARSVVSTSTG